MSLKCGRISRKVRIYPNKRHQGMDIPSYGKLVSGSQKQKAHVDFHLAGKKDGSDMNIDDPAGEWDTLDDGMDFDIDSMMNGGEEIPFSHAGGELLNIITEELQNARPPRKDTRTRRDRVHRRNEAFNDQLADLTNAYLAWSSRLGSNGFASERSDIDGTSIEDYFDITVVDMFDVYTDRVPLFKGDCSIVASLVAHGLIPCSPFQPTIAITIRTMDYFRIFSFRCPRLVIQNYTKGLCDKHGRPYKPHLSKQFSICHDLHLAILEEIDLRLKKVLLRDGDWRLRHACPSCTYVLKDEREMKFGTLITMDGNGCLKRVKKCGVLRDEVELPNGDVRLVNVDNEVQDERTITSDYYIGREEVQRWMPMKGSRNKSHSAAHEKEGIVEGETDDSPCSGRWKNMSEQSTAKALGIFDETGVFVALCRHGYVLVYTDMIKSGEGSQYPLAVVEKLLDTLGSKLAVGYDIGCRFEITLARSELGGRAKELEYTSLVGVFHGHAHNRLCQLSYLSTYVEGMGLSDLHQEKGNVLRLP